MLCPKCGYMMSAFDKECPRCQAQTTKPLSRTAPPPIHGGQVQSASQVLGFGGWYYVSGGKRIGPVEEAEFAFLYQQHKVDTDTLVWRDGAVDWLPLNQTDLVRLLPPDKRVPAVTGQGVNNTIVWILAFAPFLGLVLQGFLAGFTQSDVQNFWCATLALNLVLSFADDKTLEAAGHDTKKMGVSAFLIPVYLFKRATFLKQGNSYAWVWVICFVLSLGASAGEAANFASATPYDSWTLEHKLTGKRAVENPPEVTATDFAALPADASDMFSTPKITATINNGFEFPVGLVFVDVQFFDKSGAIVSEVTDSVGGIPASGRWQMSVNVPQGADDAKISRILVVAP